MGGPRTIVGLHVTNVGTEMGPLTLGASVGVGAVPSADPIQIQDSTRPF